MASAFRRKSLLFIGYALSGAAALIYEVVWTRLLAQQMGQSAGAVSTVLAAFMAGLGGGAVAASFPAARSTPRQALRLYAALELFIACSAIAMPVAVAFITPLLSFAYAGGSGVGFAAARLSAALLLMALPAAAMGATFPVAARAVTTAPDRPAAPAGALYAANTAGACAGALLAGFTLVPMLGLFRASLCAVALNLAAAVIAIYVASAASARSAASKDAAYADRAGSKDPAYTDRAASKDAAYGDRRAGLQTRHIGLQTRHDLLAAVALALTGFLALVNEVAWTRVLALTIGPTTYAFSAMLALFILGLAIGSAAATRLTPRTTFPIHALGIVLILGGAIALVAMRRVESLPLEVAEIVRGSNAAFGSVMRAEILMWAAVLLPLSAAFGAAFPLALRVAIRDVDAAPRLAAVLFSANTAGSLAGSLAGGFLLVPIFGLQRTIELAALTLAASGVIVLCADGILRRAPVVAVVVFAGLVVAAVRAPRWDVALLSAGAYKYAPYVRGPDLESALRAGTLMYYRDGPAATVSVRRIAGVVTLAIDGKVDASNGGDMLTQKLLAHVPLMLHARPRRVAIIGLGSGVTLGAALRHPIEHADAIEISPEVVDASRFFEAENHRALDDPRARLIVGDGRSHLLLSSVLYDVIISEPSNPWMAGVASLFTREFFLAARAALASDGILCQWAHTYDISADDLRSIAATFASVFPDGTIWLVGQGDLLLIGSPAGIVPRLSEVGSSFARPGVAQDLAEVAVPDAASVLAMYVGGPAELERYSKGAIIQTDDTTALEFSAPRDIFNAERDNATMLRALASVEQLPPIVAAARSPSGAARWRDRGQMSLAAEAYSAAFDAFTRAVTADPADQAAVDGLIDASPGAEQETIELLKKLAADDPRRVAVRVGLSRLLAASGDPAGALELVVPLIGLLPDDPRPAEQAASVLGDAGDAERLRPLAEHLQQRWPERPSARYFNAAAAFLEGRREDAEQLARDGVRAHPAEARLQILLGAASASLGRRDAARAAFQAALRISPRDAVIYTNLGLLEMDGGSPQSAIGWFAEALILDPSSTAALRGLAQALRQTGHPERAAHVEQARR